MKQADFVYLYHLKNFSVDQASLKITPALPEIRTWEGPSTLFEELLPIRPIENVEGLYYLSGYGASVPKIPLLPALSRTARYLYRTRGLQVVAIPQIHGVPMPVYHALVIAPDGSFEFMLKVSTPQSRNQVLAQYTDRATKNSGRYFPVSSNEENWENLKKNLKFKAAALCRSGLPQELGFRNTESGDPNCETRILALDYLRTLFSISPNPSQLPSLRVFNMEGSPFRIYPSDLAQPPKTNYPDRMRALFLMPDSILTDLGGVPLSTLSLTRDDEKTPSKVSPSVSKDQKRNQTFQHAERARDSIRQDRKGFLAAWLGRNLVKAESLSEISNSLPLSIQRAEQYSETAFEKFKEELEIYSQNEDSNSTLAFYKNNKEEIVEILDRLGPLARMSLLHSYFLVRSYFANGKILYAYQVLQTLLPLARTLQPEFNQELNLGRRHLLNRTGKVMIKKEYFTATELEKDFDLISRKTELKRPEQFPGLIPEVEAIFFPYFRGIVDKKIVHLPSGHIDAFPAGIEKVFSVGLQGAHNFRGELPKTGGNLWGILLPKGFLAYHGRDLGPSSSRPHATLVEISSQDSKSLFFITHEKSTKENGQVHFRFDTIFESPSGKAYTLAEYLRNHVLGVVNFNPDGTILKLQFLK